MTRAAYSDCRSTAKGARDRAPITSPSTSPITSPIRASEPTQPTFCHPGSPRTAVRCGTGWKLHPPPPRRPHPLGRLLTDPSPHAHARPVSRPNRLFLAAAAALSLLASACGGVNVKLVNSAQKKPNNVWVFFTVDRQLSAHEPPDDGSERDDFADADEENDEVDDDE